MGAQTHPLVSRDPPACIGHEPSPHIPGCPASVEGQMSCIGGAHNPLQHMSMASGEAFALLLTAVGLYSTDKQVKFEPAPIFVSLSYASIYIIIVTSHQLRLPEPPPWLHVTIWALLFNCLQLIQLNKKECQLSSKIHGPGLETRISPVSHAWPTNDNRHPSCNMSIDTASGIDTEVEIQLHTNRDKSDSHR